MGLFLSTHINKIDRKGRVSVPASFRAILGEEASPGVVLLRSGKFPCLDGFGVSVMEEMSRRLDAFDMFSNPQDDLATTLFGEAVHLPIDRDGRILIPESFMDHGGFSSDRVAFMGLGRKFQIWEPDALEKRKNAARSHVESQALTLPPAGSPAGESSR